MGEIVQSGSSSQASGGTGSSQKILDQISVLKEEHALQKSLLQIYIQDQGMIIIISVFYLTTDKYFQYFRWFNK